MKTQLLLPHSFKAIGLVLLIPALVLGVFVWHFDLELEFLTIENFRIGEGFFSEKESKENFTNEIAGISLILSLIFIGFSKLKTEDEYLMKLRLDSLKLGILVNYALLTLAFLFAYDFDFLHVIVYNLYTPLIIYIIMFHVYLWKR